MNIFKFKEQKIFFCNWLINVKMEDLTSSIESYKLITYLSKRMNWKNTKYIDIGYNLLPSQSSI